MTSSSLARSDFEPFPLGNRFLVVPPGGATSSDRIPLIVARGAFGSGEHETTSSCIELLETLPQVRGARILDLGAGTGILAIAALLLGGSRAVLVDNDARAIESSRLHCDLNGVSERVQLVHDELREAQDDSFDLALANIHGDILVHVAPLLVRSVRPGGLFVLSGIAWELNWTVRDTWARLGCHVLRNRFLGDYTTVLLERGAAT
jgi:ribosomal protein L11 methyltransferase